MQIKDLVRKLRGCLKGSSVLQDLMDERARERAREDGEDGEAVARRKD